MSKDLTSSAVERQNVLNNRYALQQAQAHLDLGGVCFEGEQVFTKAEVMALFDISDATVERYLATHGDELKANGYVLLKGKKLKEFKEITDVTLINEGNKAPVLGLFNFRAVLNLAMLLTESEKAKAVRSRLLDIVIDTLAQRAGGHTRYINQRDREFLPAAYQEFSYRKVFTDALDKYLAMGKQKYGVYTNKIYQLVFHENATEYRNILRLAEKDNPRDTMYAEVLKAIAAIENGLAEEMKVLSEEKGRPLVVAELDEIIRRLESNPYLKPVIEDARTKMASRDLGFRDALHKKLEAYVRSVPETDFERFLGETSRSLEEQLSDPETMAVFKRLKDR